ncbi:GIY-YIG nuclease family protein [Steroidobacter cummioxidans]|uniref:GIY-YIG nuclease family protein n=1 Tax=Steroidobacter cummioxidans TaxID=1803913 RepID=UPI0012903970|nr:GIY-YIG nuclease family protein [Steroidobacter cummioxidans]
MQMKAWSLIASLDPTLEPRRAKVHLASPNERGENPFFIYRESSKRFQEWQSWQSRQNFGREFVVSLIQMPQPHLWLFAGAYNSRDCRADTGGFRYQLDERVDCRPLDGRLVVRFERPGRQSYLKADNWADHMLIAELLAQRMTVPNFPGFKAVHISKAELDLIVREQDQAWKAALSSVAAVYLITDADSGKFYVGSATGEGGLWQRWSDYARTGHAENAKLKALLTRRNNTAELYFSVLEIDDMRTSVPDIRRRESHWKDVLVTRMHGLNAN